MTSLTNKTIETDSNPPIRSFASKAGRFLLHLLEMLIAMEIGMGIFHLVLGLIRTLSNYRGLESGTVLHALTMAAFMTAPMAAWMIYRGHGWRHCTEMVVAMLAPVAVIGLLCQLGVDVYIPWLKGSSMPAMLLGMIIAMLYRKDHYTFKAAPSVRPADDAASHIH